MSLCLIGPGSSDTPDSIRVIEEHLSGNGTNKILNVNSLLQDIFLVAAERGFNDEEFSLLVNFFINGSLTRSTKSRLLLTLVPNSTMAPSPVMKRFMIWFISNYHKIGWGLTVHILQWVIGMLENGLLDSKILDIFYFDYYIMLQYRPLVSYACKLLCKLTKPHDVTSSVVMVVSQKQLGTRNEKYLLALMNVFKGYKPRLVPQALPRVNLNKVLKSVPQTMDTLIKLVNRKHHRLNTKTIGSFQVPARNVMNFQDGTYKPSLLIPFPSYSLQGLDQMIASYPHSIEGAFRKFNKVLIPQNIISLLCDQTGYFLITYKGIDIQKRFSVILLQTLQNALIYQDVVASEEDVNFLLHRIYQLQHFMQQAIPCVSVFLAGYLLNWDGLDHRPHVLSLIEWVTFNTYLALSSNILRPLYMLFISYNIEMKRQIIQAATNLIRNMFIADVGRVSKGLPHPFLNEPPSWTSDPLSMLCPLVKWVEDLIRLGLTVNPNNSTLLMASVHFYESMAEMEFQSNLPMWTVISKGVIYRSLFDITPVPLNQVCRLLLRYHTVFLPKLRLQQAAFYSECSNKINLTSKYIQELMNCLWHGQAIMRKEDGVVFKGMHEGTFANCFPNEDLDTNFDLEHNVCFMPYVLIQLQNNGPDFFKQKADYLSLLEFYLEDIAAFIAHFSPMIHTP